MMASVQQTGRAAAASGVLMFVGRRGGVAPRPAARRRHGEQPAGVRAAALTATVGFALLLVATLGLRTHTAATTRPARVGAAHGGRCGPAGRLRADRLATSLLTGSPLEASFLAFLLGMLLLAVGPVTWGLSLRRRRPPAAGVWQLLVVAGLAAFAALAIEPDPWHDVSLVVMFAAWTAVGVLVLRRGSTSVSGPSVGIQGHAIDVSAAASSSRTHGNKE